MSTFKVEPHHFGPERGFSNQVCWNCGLIRAHNPMTDWSVRQGCSFREHPQFRAQAHKHGYGEKAWLAKK